MKVGACWAGLKHDLRVLTNREQQQEGLTSAWVGQGQLSRDGTQRRALVLLEPSGASEHGHGGAGLVGLDDLQHAARFTDLTDGP
jgi:hypothetical protein